MGAQLTETLRRPLFYYFLKFIYLERKRAGRKQGREREREREGGRRRKRRREREREREYPKQACAVSTETKVGLEPMNHEIIT